MKHLEKYKLKRRQYISVAFFLSIQLVTLIPPYIMGQIIDVYIPQRNARGIVLGILLFALVPFISVGFQTLYNYFLIKYIRKKGNEIALDIMRNLVYQKASYFNQENSLELLSYSSSEAVSYINFYVSDLARFYVYVLISVIILGILLFLNPYMAAFQMLYFPVSYFPVKAIMRNVEQEVQEIIRSNAQINQMKGDVFQAIEFIKLNGLEEKKLQEVRIKNREINRIWGKVSALDTVSGIWSSGFVTVLFTGVTFGLGAMFVLNSQSDFQIGQLVSFITYAGLLYSNFSSILQTNINRTKKEAEFEKVFSYLALQGEREENCKKASMCLRDRITFQNCTFAYHADAAVLDQLSIVFRKGQWTGIVGKSGSGKSTILDLILKLYEAESGQIYIDDRDINEIDAFDIRRKITKITQDVYLFPGTVESNLRLMRDGITDFEIQEALRISCMDTYIASLPNGIRTDIGEAGKLMSGGEKQRLSLAMGLLRKNSILLLDEVTANLDEATERRICENLKGLVEKGYTIISISHKKEFLKYADAIYVIDNGRAVSEQHPNLRL